jgi:hypothetical protein
MDTRFVYDEYQVISVELLTGILCLYDEYQVVVVTVLELWMVGVWLLVSQSVSQSYF